MSSNISNIIHILSIVLPFSNETAIVLTESGYSQFTPFYISNADFNIKKNKKV